MSILAHRIENGLPVEEVTLTTLASSKIGSSNYRALYKDASGHFYAHILPMSGLISITRKQAIEMYDSLPEVIVDFYTAFGEKEE